MTATVSFLAAGMAEAYFAYFAYVAREHGDYDEVVSQDAFGDIPLFREIQKILASTKGPLNLELARQVGIAMATQGLSEPPVDESTTRAMSESVRESEVLVAGYTRMALAEPARSKLVGRTEWVNETLRGFEWLFEHAANRFTGELTRVGGESENTNPMQAAIGQVAPLLLGIQIGTLVGNLARESLGRYDVPIPRQDEPGLLFLAPNIDAAARDYALDADVLRRWVALQEVSRHVVVTAVAWMQPYFRSLLTELIDAIEIDASDLEQRLMELQTKGAEMLEEGMRLEQSIPIVQTERHRRALDRFHAFISLFEGYAAHAAAAVTPQIIGDDARIEEGMARYRAAVSEGRASLEGMLGVAVDRATVASGRTFCAGVEKLQSLAFLNRAWAAPDNLPTLDEIKDPFAWIDRVEEA